MGGAGAAAAEETAGPGGEVGTGAPDIELTGSGSIGVPIAVLMFPEGGIESAASEAALIGAAAARVSSATVTGCGIRFPAAASRAKDASVGPVYGCLRSKLGGRVVLLSESDMVQMDSSK